MFYNHHKYRKSSRFKITKIAYIFLQSGGNAYTYYKIDKTNGALVVIRPDGYNAQIAPVSVAGVKEIENYFANILIPQK